mgnify:FL=1
MFLQKGNGRRVAFTLLLGACSAQASAVECDDYVQRSMQQQERNLLNLCGYRGSHWQSTEASLRAECAVMSDKDRTQRLSMRDSLLQRCPEINYAGVGRNRQRKLSMALLQAVSRKDIRLAQSLIDAGVHLTAQPELSSSPLFLAVKQGDIHMARFLMRQGAKPEALAKGETSLVSLVLSRLPVNYAFLESLLQQGANPNARNAAANQEYPIVMAATNGDIRSVLLLLKFGADPNLFLHKPALQLAVKLDHFPMVRALLQRGAKPNLGAGHKTCESETALDIAFKKAGSERMVNLLMDNRALTLFECRRN